jgi:hypothetical protein
MAKERVMPYIQQENRKKMDEIVELMCKNGVRVDGDLNYILFAFCRRHVVPSYANYRNFCGELACCREEIYRRLVTAYEDEKIRENGDVL